MSTQKKTPADCRDELLALLDRAVPMVNEYLAKAPGYSVLIATQHQLVYVQDQVRSNVRPTEEDRRRSGIIGTLVTRNFDGQEDEFGEFVSLVNNIMHLYRVSPWYPKEQRPTSLLERVLKLLFGAVAAG